jgi:hypothetical protein
MAGWVTFVTVCLKAMPLHRVLEIVSPRRHRPVKKDSVELSEKLARQLDQLLDFNILCFTPTCWKRAAVLHRYLALNGIETRVVFGVRKDVDEALAGHAWIEADGVPILESTDPEYTVTYIFPHDSKPNSGMRKAESRITQAE